MCLAYPGKILKIKNQLATVDFNGVEKEINISLVDGAKKNDYVIVHAGFAIQKIGKEEALDAIKFFKNG